MRAILRSVRRMSYRVHGPSRIALLADILNQALKLSFGVTPFTSRMSSDAVAVDGTSVAPVCRMAALENPRILSEVG